MHINSHAIHPFSPNRAPEWPNPMFFSRNLTPSANSNWLAEGVKCIKCLTSERFWPSAS
jgi:hypothetical protein